MDFYLDFSGAAKEDLIDAILSKSLSVFCLVGRFCILISSWCDVCSLGILYWVTLFCFDAFEFWALVGCPGNRGCLCIFSLLRRVMI